MRKTQVEHVGDRAGQLVVTVTCDAASAELEVELARAGSLSPGRRNAVLGCIEHHLSEARHALVHARDPEERAEYEATHERLREVSEMVWRASWASARTNGIALRPCA